MAELMHPNAFVVIPVNRQTEDVLLTEARRLSARAPHALVLIGWIWWVSVLGHVGIDLVLAYDDQVHAVGNHRLQNIWPACQHVGDAVTRALQRVISDFSGCRHVHA